MADGELTEDELEEVAGGEIFTLLIVMGAIGVTAAGGIVAAVGMLLQGW